MTALLANSQSPPAQGLYSPASEHDSCGVNFVVDLKGRASHGIVETGIGALCNLQHRGALGAEFNTGDGAGILIQVPDRFLRAVVDFDLPPAGEYATGMAFLPQDPGEAEKAVDQIEKLAGDESLDPAAVLSAARRLAGRGPAARHSALPLPERWQQTSFTLDKRP